MSSLFLKLFFETALIISFDKSFHSEAIRLLKRLKRWSQILFNSLMSCPLSSPRGGALIGGYDLVEFIFNFIFLYKITSFSSSLQVGET